MSMLNRWFGSKKPEAPVSAPPEPNHPPEDSTTVSPAPSTDPTESHTLSITLEKLKRLFPIRNLDYDELASFTIGRKAELFPEGAILFREGEVSDSVHFLLNGSVRMALADGKIYEISADSAKARFPLCCGKRYSATAMALTPVQILRVSPRIMSKVATNPEASGIQLDPNSAHLPIEVRSSRLFQTFCQHFHGEKLKLPSLPEVALKLRKAIEKEASTKEIAALVQLDPVIAAKIVHIANSPLYYPTRSIHHCQDAVTRLGVRATRTLVTAFCMRGLYRGKNPHVGHVLEEQWRQGIVLSSLCHVLALHNPGVDPQEALLAGLLCDIGVVPFLSFAEEFPQDLWNPDELETILPHVSGPVGSYLLQSWDFPPELAVVPQTAGNWYYGGAGERLTLCDIVILSRLHDHIGEGRLDELPAINSIPACSKLKDGSLSPDYTLNVLHEARDMVEQTMAFFAG